LQLRNNLCIQRNAQKIFGYDRIITARQELLQEDVHANDDKEGNAAQMLVEKEVEANSEVANILLELGDVNKPMLIDEEPEKEYAAQQHQLQPDQLMLHYREKLIIAQQQLEPWLADCHVRYWEHFENEEQDFFEHQQHQEEEDELEIEELLDEEVIDNIEYNKARALTCLYATYLIGWTEGKTKQEKLAIAEAASTMVAYEC